MAQLGARGRFKVGGLAIGRHKEAGGVDSAEINAYTGALTASGTSATFAGTTKAKPGSLLVSLTTLKLYINTNTQASPTWTIVGTQS